MDFKSIITFKINNNQYYLHYDVVKELPIFEELKKSNNMETIEYLEEISDAEINICFNFLYKQFSDYSTVQLDSIIRIVNFMMFLTIETKLIEIFISNAVQKYSYAEIVDYGIRTKQNKAFFERFLYKEDTRDYYLQKKSIYQKSEFLIELENEQYKPMLVDMHIETVCKKYNYSSMPCRKYYGKSDVIDAIYYIFFNVVPQRPTYESNVYFIDGKPSCYIVNKKKIRIGNVKEINDGKETEYDLFDTITNHIRQVLLKKVEL